MDKKYDEFDLTQYSALYNLIADDLNSGHEHKELLIALDLAAELHKGQKRMNGDAYIGHVLRVANMCAFKMHGVEYCAGLGKSLGYSLKTVIVALLHDTVEDGHISFDGLIAAGISKEVVESVKTLTIKSWANETYFAFTMRIIASNDLAGMQAKIEDIGDNSRDLENNHKHKNRLEKYRFAKYLIEEKIDQLKNATGKKWWNIMSWFKK